MIRMMQLKLPNVPLYMRASMITSCVAMLFGFDTGIIGPVTTMKAFRETFGELSSTLHGVVVSSILLPGALSALVAGILADKFGRTRIISQGALVYGVGSAIECGAPSLGVFILGRLIKGVGEGLFLSAVYVQIAEISPTRIRGILSSIPQFLITVGIAAGFFVCYGTSTIKDSSAAWRLPSGIGAGLAFAFSISMLFVPPSPRWLLARGQVDQARKVIERLGLDAAEQMELLNQTDPALEHAANSTFVQELRQMFTEFGEAFSKPFRARTALGCFILGMEPFSGIDGVLYYAPLLLQQAGLSSEQATFLASGVSAIVIVVTTIPATLLADKWGRRTSSITGGILITILMLVMGSLYAGNQVHADRGAGRWVVIVAIYLFAIAFSATWAIGMRTFLVESQPKKTRSSVASLAQAVNWVSNYVVALITPILISAATFSTYYLFTFMTLFCTIIIAIFMFETKGHSLEVIEQRYVESRALRATGNGAASGIKLSRFRFAAGRGRSDCVPPPGH